MALRIWNGGSATTNNWSDVDNWGVTGVPVAGDDLEFGGVARVTNVNDLAADISINNITINGTAGNFSIGGNSITLTGNITISKGSLQTISLAMILTTAHSITSTVDSADINLSGVLSGTGSILRTAASSLTGIDTTVSGNNTFSGGWTHEIGAFNINNANALGTGTLIVQKTATFEPGICTLGGNYTIANDIQLLGGRASGISNLFRTASNTNATLTGNITIGGANLSNGSYIGGQGTGTMIATGTVTCNARTTSGFTDLAGFTFSGRLLVNSVVFTNDSAVTRRQIAFNGAGVLILGQSNALDSRVDLRFGIRSDTGTGTFDMAGFSQSVTNITRVNTITASSAIIGNSSTTADSTLTVIGGTQTWGGIIRDTYESGSRKVNVVINSSGVITFSGANTYTGTTSVNAGTLRVSGSLAAGSTVAVNSGGRLDGPGTVSGPITVKAGGTISPGDGSIATLTTGSVTIENGGTLAVSLNGTTPSADLLAVTGTLTLQATSALSVESIVSSTVGDAYTINTSSVIISGTFNGLADGDKFMVSGRTLQINYPSSTSIVITDVLSVPLGSLMMPFFSSPSV